MIANTIKFSLLYVVDRFTEQLKAYLSCLQLLQVLNQILIAVYSYKSCWVGKFVSPLVDSLSQPIITL